MPVEDSASGAYGELWRAADKVVCSSTLEAVGTARTRLERRFEPAAVRAMKAAATAPISVGGAALAGEALLAGLVDRLELLLVPVIVGGGPRAIPEGLRARLALLEQTRLATAGRISPTRSAAPSSVGACRSAIRPRRD